MSLTIDWEKMHHIEELIQPQLAEIDRLVDRNQSKVLRAFADAQISDSHLFGSTGYGLGDRGREQLDAVFARAVGAQAALVRPGFVSGTHALTVAYFGLLRPGDHLLYATGKPYDTLEGVIGLRGEGMGSLREYGISFSSVSLQEDESIDIAAVLKSVSPQTKVVAFQRSPGYSWRRALTVAEIAHAAKCITNAHPHVTCVVDNCYGEFTEDVEPTALGVEVIVGSLIKNPGGGIAPTGGYIAGDEAVVERISHRLTAPGIGGESGSYENYRPFYQGLFLAPHVVGQALKGNIFAAAALTEAGFDCAPQPDEKRGDIVLRVRLGSADRLVRFCQAIQQASPIDAHVLPEPWQMPGYGDPVIMAAGAFVQGSSIELSADGPLREPFIAYLQGGLTYSHVKLAVMHALSKLT